MAKTKIRITVEAEIDDGHIENKGPGRRVTPEKVLNGICLYDSDDIDGFNLTTDIPGFNPAEDFFLWQGKITKREFMD